MSDDRFLPISRRGVLAGGTAAALTGLPVVTAQPMTAAAAPPMMKVALHVNGTPP